MCTRENRETVEVDQIFKSFGFAKARHHLSLGSLSIMWVGNHHGYRNDNTFPSTNTHKPANCLVLEKVGRASSPT